MEAAALVNDKTWADAGGFREHSFCRVMRGSDGSGSDE